ncbi:saccharopine dehydrogenase C-terminal domain-containing protein [Compostibacter hankyongensis]|uniref:Saccharopine dehydrogenase C-terminal domain-containing protein n=1 Tax=Compostibacter hankyongensis TaxID=1007089 RepID=A0ABP8FK58_9BACT
MKKILLFGAGKSATSLIDYLIEHAPRQKWQLTVADRDLMLIRIKIGKSYYATPAAFDVHDAETRQNLISESDVVISLLPPELHLLVIKDCIRYRKHILIASYLTPEMYKLEKEVRKAGILFMGEMGLDPGIDHMSAKKLIHSIESKGGTISSFRSFCGGLIPPECDDNPWHYKVSWNPRNVVLAGQEGALYREKGKDCKVDYADIFSHSRNVTVPGLGKMDWYPNRDSLSYAARYGIEDVPTFVRGTLRYPDFCEGWDALVRLGLTDNKTAVDTDTLTYRKWALQNCKASNRKTPEEALIACLDIKERSKVMKQLKFLGLTDNLPINRGKATNAEVLGYLLDNKLPMKPEDKDMVVMQHELSFERRNFSARITSYMIMIGEDNLHTAMSQTVGYPLGILTRLLLTGKVSTTGIHIPILPEIYNPVLKELEQYGVRFAEAFE